MNFTVVFKATESQIYTYGLVFIPTVCWIYGNCDCSENVLFDSQSINYKLGYVNELIKVIDERAKSNMEMGYFESLDNDKKSCVVVVDSVGHGNFETLELLIKDLHEEGFKTNIVYL